MLARMSFDLGRTTASTTSSETTKDTTETKTNIIIRIARISFLRPLNAKNVGAQMRAWKESVADRSTSASAKGSASATPKSAGRWQIPSVAVPLGRTSV
jgi:hypothetical protein